MVRVVNTSKPPKSKPAATRGKNKPPFSARRKVVPEPSHAEIAERAYYLYLERVRKHGDAFDDWLRAERELRQAAHRTQASAARRSPQLEPQSSGATR